MYNISRHEKRNVDYVPLMRRQEIAAERKANILAGLGIILVIVLWFSV